MNAFADGMTQRDCMQEGLTGMICLKGREPCVKMQLNIVLGCGACVSATIQQLQRHPVKIYIYMAEMLFRLKLQ